MSDQRVAKFKLQGRVCLWQYRIRRKGWDDWNFSADRAGCESLLQLIQLIEDAPYSSRVELPLAVPPESVLSVPTSEVEGARFARSWTLVHPKDQVTPDTWELTPSLPNVALRFGTAYVDELRKAVRDAAAGRGDYAIGSDSTEQPSLWIWWWSGA